jgi:hypothetical protein
MYKMAMSYKGVLTRNTAPVDIPHRQKFHVEEKNRFSPRLPRARRANPIVRDGTVSYSTWEYHHMRQIKDIKDILLLHVNNGIKSIDFHQFGNFLYDNSSKYVSPFNEEMNEMETINYVSYIKNFGSFSD